MSRIGNMLISIPQGVEVNADKDNNVTVKGPKGTLEDTFSTEVTIEVSDKDVTVKRATEDRRIKSLHGLTTSKISNMIEGVTKGYSKTLELVGVGYRAAMQGKDLVLNVGYSHPVNINPPEGIEIELQKNNKIVVKGIDKQKVGDLAARIRRVCPPEPYKGKGIKYEEEYVRRKIGKAGK